MRFIDSCSTSTLGAQNWTYADQNDAACEQWTSPIATSSRFRQWPFSSTPWCSDGDGLRRLHLLRRLRLFLAAEEPRERAGAGRLAPFLVIRGGE